MTVTSIIASTATYYRTRGSNATYATARNTCSSISATYRTGNSLSAGNYFVDRLTQVYVTSVIPLTDYIESVALRMVCTTDHSDTDFDVHVCEYDWSASDPLAAGNQEAVFDGILAEADYFVWRNTSGIAINTQYTSPSLNIPYINRAGSTYYALRVSTDYTNTTPTTDDYLTLAGPAHATESYRPTLIVTHFPVGDIIGRKKGLNINQSVNRANI